MTFFKNFTLIVFFLSIIVIGCGRNHSKADKSTEKLTTTIKKLEILDGVSFDGNPVWKLTFENKNNKPDSVYIEITGIFFNLKENDLISIVYNKNKKPSLIITRFGSIKTMDGSVYPDVLPPNHKNNTRTFKSKRL